MKRQIIVRIIVCIAAVALLCAGLFAMNACGNKTGNDGATYQLNLSNYDGIVTYGEPMDYSRITLTRTENGVSTEIPVDASMVTTHVDTNKVGAKLIKFNYAGQNFHVPAIVKYRLQFEVDGEVFETLYVLNVSELEEIEVPEKPGYTFAGWSEDIPGVITDNMTFSAVYTPVIPEIAEVDATYGDELKAIQLPYTVAGAWSFDNAEGTVGDVGKKTFPVSFIAYETGEVLATDTLTVNVAKKEVSFFEVVDSFIYNGNRQLPTYKTDVPVNVIFYEDAEANYTDAGKYDYYFEVDDPNYKGTLVGSYEIKPANVTVKINSYTVFSNEELPTVEYQVLGFDNIELIGLSVTNPEDVVSGVGTYTLTATASNPNIVLTVEEGTLTVNSSSLEIADPTLIIGDGEDDEIIYGDLLTKITFATHPNGKWTWKNPTDLVGAAGKQTHIAVFTPTDSRYDVIERAVEITVSPKAMIIEIVGSTTVDYDGNEHTVSYVVKDGVTGEECDLVVLGNVPYKNAGSYELTLTLEDENYTATRVVTFVINKIDPVVDFDQVVDATWSKSLKLGDIALPAGYAWNVSLDTLIPNAGTHRFAVIYTPEDTVNYNSVSGELAINAAKAAASINNVNASYGFTYNGGIFNLDTITRSHTESELVFTYQKDGQTVASLLNAGVYTVTITLPETQNYNEAVATTTVTIEKANNGENVILSQAATYGDLIFDKITLPAGIEGTWSIKDADAATTVGDAGTKTFVAIYTSTTGNYIDREVEITVTVAKKRINAPTISAANREQVFTGATLNSGLADAEGYTVTDNGGINVGTYTVTVALVNDNYLWSDGSGEAKELTYKIAAAENQWTTAPTISGWTFGDVGNAGVAEALAGTVTVEYKLLGAEDSTYSTTVPVNAGAYVARFTVTDSNYKDLVATCEFTIAKKTVTVPTISATNKVQVYTGSTLASGLAGTDEYSVTDHGGAGVGTYTVTLVLGDKNNYKWATTDSSENVFLTYEIVKAQIVFEEFAIEGWTYGSKANAPTYKTNFTTQVIYKYATAIDGEYTDTVPSAAGTYYVKAYAQGNENLLETTTEAQSFTIAKASVTINGAKDDTKVYDTKEYVITGVTASNGEALTVVITKNGEVVEKIVGAGEYTVTFSLAESDNYLAAEKSVTVTVTPATNSETVIVNQNATYGDLISVIQLPTGVEGTWSIKETDATVGDAGVKTFTAVFTSTTGNYEDKDVIITVNVAKKKVNAPTISAAYREQIFTGATLTSGIVNAEGYIVTDEGGINVGTYTVTVALANDNYVWSDGTSADKTLTYKVVAAQNSWAVQPEINDWIYGQDGNAGSATAEFGGVKIEYKLATDGDDAYSTKLPENAGNYVARFTTTDTNHTKLTETISFTIAKATVDVPTVGNKTYTGANLISGLTSTELYTVTTDNGGIVVGTYKAVLTLVDASNYQWSTTEAATVEVSYQITKAQAVISDFAIDDWTFGQGASVPTASTNFGTVSYVYATASDGDYTATRPTNAGTYYVKAIVVGTDNFDGAESEPISFTVAKASVTINGAKDDTKVYDTKEYVITGVTASNGEALTVVITKNGEVVEKIVGAGEYTVTFSLAESDNYLAAEKSVTVTVTPATNSETVIVNQNATYGDLISVIQLPTGVEGTWSIKETDATVGDAGVKTFTAVFTSTTGNYEDKDVIITVNVAKATVKVPIVDPKEYDEQHHNSGLTNTDDYTVTADIGGTDHGTYEVEITLNDPANYKWETSDEATITIKYEISAAINKWADEPAISPSWEYESTGDAGHATALHGGVKIEYKLESADDSAYSTELPTLPGKYVARFTTTDDNYTVLRVTKAFEITKRKITPPTQTATEFVYTGNTITSGIEANDFYTVVDGGAINAQAGLVATVTLKSEYYVWADGVEALAREYTYSITKAQITVSAPTIADWTFGEKASVPTSSTNFVCEITYVYASTINGDYTEKVPTDAGTYYVKAIAAGDENLIGATSAATKFTVAKAQASINGAEESYTAVYNGSDYIIEGITASYEGAPALEYAKVQNAGTHTVVITLPEGDNYLGASVTVTVIITPAENTIDEVDQAQNATYGDSIGVIKLPTSSIGTWSIQGDATTVGDAGVNTFTAVFTPANGNYNGCEVEITVTVAKKVVSAPAISADKAEQTYTGALLTSGLTGGTGYTVTDEGGTNVGTYTVTVALVSDNYVWSDGTSDDKTFSYTINQATNYWDVQPDIDGWIYGQAGNTGSATAEFGGVMIEYKPAGANDDAYSTVLPENAGDYIARFTTTDTNYTKLVETRSFTIAKATVNVPSVEDITYNGTEQSSGLANTDDYTVVDENHINVGTYTATLTLKDSSNYKWNTTEDATVTVSYKIVKAQIVISDLAIDGWTFGDDANAPTASANFGNVTYVYASANGGDYTENVPTNAGTYYVKAVVAGDDNLIGAESAPVFFTIAKAQASINGAEETYNATYNGSVYTITGVTSSNGLDLEYAYTKDGGNVSEIKNAGTYTVVITLPESENYLGASVTVTVTINKIVNTDTIPTYTATYGDLLSTLTPPESATGTWSWKTAGTVGNAGTQTHVLVFTPDDATNYEGREADATVTVSKKTVATPAVPNASVVYNGGTQYSGLTDNTLYTVTDEGGINVGSYTATLTLVDPANYAWNNVDNESATVAVSYAITPAENEISVTPPADFAYGQELVFEVSVLYGGYKVEYKLASADDSTYTTTAPTARGYYKARFTTTDPNCSIKTVECVFNITNAAVTPDTSNVKSEYTYTGEKITTGLTDTEYYTVTEVGGIDVGTYTAVLSLKDKESSVWYTGNSDDITITYKIVKNQNTKLEGVTAGWTYGAYVAPTVTVSPAALADKVIFWYSVDGGASWSNTAPTNAGTTYQIKAEIQGTDNYAGFVTDPETFVIAKATPTVATNPSFVGGKFYQNMFKPTGDGAAVTYNGNTVTGSWTFVNAVFADGTNASSVEYKFTPDSTNYNEVTGTYNITFVSVAYLDNTTPYGTIEAAIAAANAAGSGVVWVRPYDADLKAIYITEDITINAGVTLLLPYGTDGTGRNTYSSEVANFDLHGGACSKGNHEQGQAVATESQCHVMVVLADGKKITNNGTIEVSGQLSGGGAGALYAGQTAGEHARLILGANATIENNGVIRAAGFIREQNKNNGSSVIVNSGATLYQPYVLKDYISGQYLVGPYKQMQNSVPMSPFNMFILMNVSPELTIRNGGTMVVWAALYTGSTDGINTTKTTFIGTGGVIEFTAEQSYLTAKFDIDTEVCKLNVYGGAKTNSMQLKINVGISLTINTKDCLFPVTYLYDITLNSGAYTMAQRFKLMPGAKLTVAEDATLNADLFIVYDETFVDERAITAGYRYPANKGAAVLTVNGALTCGTLGGKVISNTEGATVTVNTAVSYTAYEPKAYVSGTYTIFPCQDIAERYTIAQQATLVNGDKVSMVLPATGTTTTYTNGEWITTLAVHFDANGGDAVTSITMSTNEAYPALPTPTKAHYVFAGWKDADGNIVGQGNALPALRDAVNGITLTAQWTPAEYNLNYEWKFEGFDADPTITWAEGLGTFNIETAQITLPTPTNATGSFVGWYTDAECGNVILNGTISGAELVELYGGNATVYGLWTNQHYTIKFEGDAFDDVPYTNDTVVYTPTQLTTATLPAIPTTYETDVTVDKYFEGWYYNGTKVTDFSFITDSAQEYTLTAKWNTKFTVIFKYGDVVKGKYFLMKEQAITTPTDDISGWETGSAGGYYLTFANWSNDTYGTVDANAAYNVPEAANDVSAVIEYSASITKSAYVYNAVTVTVGTSTTLSITGGSWKNADGTNCSAPTKTGTYYLLSDSSVTITVKVTASTNYTPKLGLNGEAASETTTQTKAANELTAIETTSTYSGSTPCIVEGTLITLADGTQKKVEDLTHDDLLLVFNHETGMMETGYVAMLDHLEMDRMWVNVINFTFSNGETLRMVWNHGVFDATLNQYVLVNEDNYSEFVGHKFYSTYYNGSKFVGELVTLTDAFLTNEYIKVYNPTSYWHMNYFSNGILNVTAAPADHVGGHVNIFELDEDMKYDAEQMQADIEKYGLYTYDDFAEYLTEEQFYALPFAYLKVAVGKGNIDWESIVQIVEYIKAGSLLD